MAKVSLLQAAKFAVTLAYSIYVIMHAKMDNLFGVFLLLANLRVTDYFLYEGKAIQYVYKNLRLATPLKVNMGLVNGLKMIPKLAIVAALIIYVSPLRILAVEPYLLQLNRYVAISSFVRVEFSTILSALFQYVVLPIYQIDYFLLQNILLARVYASAKRISMRLTSKTQVAAARKRRI